MGKTNQRRAMAATALAALLAFALILLRPAGGADPLPPQAASADSVAIQPDSAPSSTAPSERKKKKRKRKTSKKKWRNRSADAPDLPSPLKSEIEHI